MKKKKLTWKKTTEVEDEEHGGRKSELLMKRESRDGDLGLAKTAFEFPVCVSECPSPFYL